MSLKFVLLTFYFLWIFSRLYCLPEPYCISNAETFYSEQLVNIKNIPVPTEIKKELLAQAKNDLNTRRKKCL